MAPLAPLGTPMTLKLKEIVLVEEKSKRELQTSFSYYPKVKVSDDTAGYPASTEVKFGSSPVIEMNRNVSSDLRLNWIAFCYLSKGLVF